MASPAASGGTATLISALFRDRNSAERAYREARELGYADDELNVLLSEETKRRSFGGRGSTDFAQKAAEGTENTETLADDLGGPPGATAGTVAPALAALGTLLLVPGLGILAAGPVAVALTAAGAVGVTGGLIGALTDWGIPKSRVERYEKGIREGGIVIAVQADSEKNTKALKDRWRKLGDYVED